MVLSQYNWPKEVELFTSVLSRIQKQGSFTYREFFDYIISILIITIEEFCCRNQLSVPTSSTCNVLPIMLLIFFNTDLLAVEMLEEIMYLINQGKVNIDIMPCDGNTRYMQS